MASKKEVYTFFICNTSAAFNSANGQANNYENYKKGLADATACTTVKVSGAMLSQFLKQAPIVYPNHIECVNYIVVGMEAGKDITAQKIAEINQELKFEAENLKEVEAGREPKTKKTNKK